MEEVFESGEERAVVFVEEARWSRKSEQEIIS
jgi:hypothetical protein